MRSRWRSSLKVTSDKVNLPSRSTKICCGPLTKISLTLSSFKSVSSGPKPLTSSNNSWFRVKRSSRFKTTPISSRASLVISMISALRSLSVALSKAERFRLSNKRLCNSTLISPRRSRRFFSLSTGATFAGIGLDICEMFAAGLAAAAGAFVAAATCANGLGAASPATFTTFCFL